MKSDASVMAIKHCQYDLTLGEWRECMIKLLDLSTNQLTYLAGSPECGFTDGNTGPESRLGYADDLQGMAWYPDGATWCPDAQGCLIITDGAHRPAEAEIWHVLTTA